MYMKIVIFLSVFLFTGCFFSEDIYLPQPQIKSQKTKQSTKEEKTITLAKKEPSFYKKSSDWTGYYYGVLPCASCAGVETWLYLGKDGKKAVYELSENYLQTNDGVFRSKGVLEWQEELIAKMIAKDETRYVFIGKDLVTFINAPDEALQNEYALRRLDSFAGYGQQLLVSPKNIQTGKIDGKKAIKFNALMNFEYKNELGYKSLKASYEIKCQADKYSMPKIIYFQDSFATGEHKEVFEVKTVYFRGENDVLRQVAKKYCN